MQNIGRCSIVRMGGRYGFSTTNRSVCGRHEVIWAEGGDTFESGDDLTLVGQLREDGSVEMVTNEEGEMSNKTAMTKAERSIAQALAELERATEGYVRRVEIIDLDVSTYSDGRRQVRRRVSIDLEPKPGTNWEGE